MGRNFPSATALVRQTASELQHLGEMLPLQDRIALNQFADFALNNRAAIANAASLQPLEAMILLLLLKEQKERQRMEYDLRIEIERLKADLL